MLDAGYWINMENSHKKGMVYLVGTGPGDPGLITVKALEAIRKAEVVVYDYLANPRLLSDVPGSSEKIYVGKESSKHTLPQDEINELLVKHAQLGKIVVRLKGGDPFIFGRGGEEAEYLASHHVTFEIIPGITSAIAVPAYAGIPLTHRDYTPSVAFITGHERPDREKSTIPWKELATGPGTLVFLMGVKNLPLISRTLIQYGRAPQTPAAVIRWGTFSSQQTLVGTLYEMPQKVEEAGLKPPAIIIIGEVVRLRENLNWFEERPLFGKRIVVTRSRAQASQLVESLENYGAQVIEYPTILIKKIDPNPELEEAIRNLDRYDWAIFTSVNGVECFFEYMDLMDLDTRFLGRLKIGAIGPATAEGLKKRSIKADFIPEAYKAEGIIDGLISIGIKAKRVLIPRAAQAREVLPQQLSEKGADVHVIPVYETLPDEEADSDELVEYIKAGEISMITFTSSSTVTNFFSIMEGRIKTEELKGVIMACIGPITEKKLAEKGFAAQVVPEKFTIPALVDAILAYYRIVCNDNI
jgi:uroporphyrinogen III methyltransferase/synthase